MKPSPKLQATVYTREPIPLSAETFATLAPGATPSVDGSALVMRWPDGTHARIHAMSETELPTHLEGLLGFSNQAGADATLLEELATIQQAFGFVAEGERAGEHVGELIAAVVRRGRGWSLLPPGELYDPEGRPLYGRTAPPTAERVSQRALVLLAVACRALLEDDAGTKNESDAEAARQDLATWARALDAELEASERQVLGTPIGKLSQRARIDAVWRGEGAAVLLWSLGARELAAPDVSEHPYDLARGVGLLRFEEGVFRPSIVEALTQPRLRSADELDWMYRRLLGLHWRSVELRVNPGRAVDMVAFARDNFFGGMDLTGLPLAEDDVAVDGVPIARARDAGLFGSIAVERHVAILWLTGQHALYSEIIANT
ncbi:MAG: DUF4272 domain-containing protein [Myxococcales bacterium]|nr:DUF4272 domain-containing protein [Myxococcales bacterium]